MRKLAIIAAASAMLIASNAHAAKTQQLDPKALAQTIMNLHKFTGNDKGSFAIVYGGQDISRGRSVQPAASFVDPVYIG
jgi:hypothetical protein